MGPLLAEYFDHLFFSGAELHEATRTLAAVLWKLPALGRGDKRSLPEARQALQGSKRLFSVPRSPKMEVTPEMMCGMAAKVNY